MITIENVTPVAPDFGTLLSLIKQFEDLSEFEMLPTICMMIDTAAAKRHETSEEILKQITPAIKAVNEECGKYNPYAGEGVSNHETV